MTTNRERVAPTRYANEAQQRVLRTLAVIAQNGATGLTAGEIAKLVGTLPSNSTRDIANLVVAGMVEETTPGRFTAKPLLVSIERAWNSRR